MIDQYQVIHGHYQGVTGHYQVVNGHYQVVSGQYRVVIDQYQIVIDQYQVEIGQYQLIISPCQGRTGLTKTCFLVTKRVAMVVFELKLSRNGSYRRAAYF